MQAETAPSLAEQEGQGMLIMQHTMPEGRSCLTCLTSFAKLIEAVSKQSPA